MKILFEPWSLGDAIIAASALRENLNEYALACHPRWHAIVREALDHPPDLKLIPVELDYATLKNANEFSWFKKIYKLNKSPSHTSIDEKKAEVYSIRGDFRDYIAARDLFPNAQVNVSGWKSFIARRSALVNYPYQTGFIPVKNRYASWAELLGYPFHQTVTTYKNQIKKNEKYRRDNYIGIHVGAQWRSRQYPYVAALKKKFIENGFEVLLLAGNGDTLPENVQESEVVRLMGNDLITKLKELTYLVVNDSGPMHLAAFLGVPTFCVARISNIREWIPPTVDYISAEKMPTGYRADKYYKSDERLLDWPNAFDVFSRVFPKIKKFKLESTLEANGKMNLVLSKPKVSILIPVYNREKFIGDCIESALSQTYYNHEVVISDNASTDRTFEICQEYAAKDKRVKVFRLSKNEGPVANWKNCIEHARGEYGKILFSDDCMHPLFIEKTLKLLENEKLGFVFSAVKIGPEIPQSRVWYPWKNESGVYMGEEFIRSLYDGKPVPVSPGCALFRMDDLKRNIISQVITEQKIDFTMHGAGTDVLFYLLAASQYKKVGFIAEPLTFFRSHDGSITKSNKDGSVKRAYNHALVWFSQNSLNGRYMTKLLSRIWLEELLIHKAYISPSQSWKKYINRIVIFPVKIKILFSFIFYLSKRLKQHYF